MTRQLSNWIDSFFELTDTLPSPAIFRRWAGIALIAGTLERRVWVKTGHASPLYPNLYTFLVAPPGVGKTAVTSIIWDFWNHLKMEDSSETFHLAPASTTSAAIMDDLRDAERRIIRLGDFEPVVKFNALAICSNELGTLLPEYESSFMSKLTDLYDCHHYSERRRTKELQFAIDNPVLNIVAATTPGYLTSMLPEGAWDQGFLSRTLIVYSGETVVRDLFMEFGTIGSLHKKLATDLLEVFKLYGKMVFTEEAKTAIGNWHRNPQPIPEHPRLMHYNTRRTAHLIKLCMVASASQSDELIIDLGHFEQAMDWLLELEIALPEIFKSMQKGGSKQAIDECWHFAYTTFMREMQKPISEHRLVAFLQERVPVHEVFKIIEVMERAGMLRSELVSGIGKAYIPAKRTA